MTTRWVLTITMIIMLLIVPLFASVAKAEYIRTGHAIGHESHGLVVKLHDQHIIAAVEKDGKLYELNEVWGNVDKYNESTGICSQYINALKKPILLEKTEKGYKRINADYVTFPCIKR